ncbi:beta-sarcoglycan [Centruroides vittatus]|uniref:beta-sarcoglycan n=1 Tax=Centruroides vittatus TaxID=120091 RepID=UPI00350F949D
MAAGEGNSTLSMREKALLKHHINKQHNSNFKAGYVPIYEPYLHKTGLRGRKGMLFYALVILLFIIALANLAVTVLLLSVLRIGYGMESMEFIRPGLLLRFLHHADMGRVLSSSGIIGGFAEKDLPIIGDSQPVILHATSKGFTYSDGKNTGPSMEVGPDWTLISDVEEFRVRSPSTGQTIFSTKYQDFKLPAGIPNLYVKEAHVSRITSGTNQSLEVSSPYQVMLKGNEGLTVEGKEIIWVAGQDLHFKSVNQSIILDGRLGVMIPVDKIPLAAEPQDNSPRWYKVCVCVPSGRIFRVPVRDHGYGCHDVRFPESINPCT